MIEKGKNQEVQAINEHITGYTTEVIAVDSLKPHPKNYNSHPEDQLEHLIQSIKDNGIYRNIVIAQDNTILAGHGVVEAVKKMGGSQVPVIRIDISPDNARALKILAGDNEVRNLVEKDDRLLSELLKQIKEEDISGLLGTGYDEMMLANLVFVTRSQNEISDFNAAAEWIGMPEYEPVPTPLQIAVSFANHADRQSFAKKIGARITDKTKSLWWPLREQKDDIVSIKFETDV